MMEPSPPPPGRPSPWHTEHVALWYASRLPSGSVSRSTSFLTLLLLAAMMGVARATCWPPLQCLQRPANPVHLHLPARSDLEAARRAAEDDGDVEAPAPRVRLQRLCKTLGQAHCAVGRLCGEAWCAEVTPALFGVWGAGVRGEQRPTEAPAQAGMTRNVGQLPDIGVMRRMVYGVDYILACRSDDDSAALTPITTSLHEELLGKKIMDAYPSAAQCGCALRRRSTQAADKLTLRIVITDAGLAHLLPASYRGLDLGQVLGHDDRLTIGTLAATESEWDALGELALDTTAQRKTLEAKES
jgi:hypothetical protein